MNNIEQLNEFSIRYDETTMLAMYDVEFERFFTKIYMDVKEFSKKRNNQKDSVDIVNVACQLLERAINHNKDKKKSVTKNAVEIFEKTTETLLCILNSDLDINERVYEDSRKTSLQLNALKACGIFPPGHYENLHPRYNRFPYNQELIDSKEFREGLDYAKNNISEFTWFAYNLGNTKDYIRDPFADHSQTPGLRLYERVKFLNSKTTDIKMIQENEGLDSN